MPKGTDKAPTPVMRQFFAAKALHKDAVLFFRMGDFYELFYEDAVIASKALDLTLTSRNKGAEDEIPMAGVPHHAASGYIQRLLDQGMKVAICEQMADPSTVKGIVPREVVRVVSPGIVFDDAGLSARENHFLAAIECDATGVGIAAVDLSTGELSACSVSDAAGAVAEIARLDPRELLVGQGAFKVAEAVALVRPRLVVRAPSEAAMSEAEAVVLLDGVLGAGQARASGAVGVALMAAARCVAMAQVCEPGRALPIQRLVSYEVGDTLVLDESTQAHLELVRSMDGERSSSLLAHIDATKTSPGARLLRARLLAPRTNMAEIRRRLDAVELFVVETGLRLEMAARLSGVGDLERLAVKLAVDRAGPRDLAALRSSLGELPRIADALSACRDPNVREVLGIAPAPSEAVTHDAPWIDTCADLFQRLATALVDDPPVRASDGGILAEGFDAELDEARGLARNGQRMIVDLEARLRERSAIASLKLRFTRVFGWYIEVTKSHVDKAPNEWRRKQTIANGERFTCDELDQLADKLAHAEEHFATREAELFRALLRELAAHEGRLRAVAKTIAEWDVASALAEIAHRNDYVRPDVDESVELVIEDGRHPVVEKLAAAGRFVPNDVLLDASKEPDAGRARFWLVTGPNMAGKSTLMRQVAVIVILAQMGSFVPARKAKIGVVDRVLTRVGASDNVSKGESTFMVEMKETARVLRRATGKSLVILDEIGRGTSTYDGLAIAWAVAEHLYDAVGCRALFATHYHEMTELAKTRPFCQNWSVSAKEYAGDIVFLHKLHEGAASQSYGVACARLAGLPEPVLARARAILVDLERGAALPSGGQASLRARGRGGRPQLDLFAGGAPEASIKPHPVVDTLRAVDVDRLTPLEALQLVARLKKVVEEG